jgi:hypothetical protein
MRALAVIFSIHVLIGTTGSVASVQDTTRARRATPRTPIGPPPEPQSDTAETVQLKFGLIDDLGAAVRQAMRDSLDAQRRIWIKRRPRAYVIRVLTVDHCIHVRTGVLGTTIPRVTVIGDRLVKREEAPIPHSYVSHCWHEWGVEDLFSDLTRSIADTTRSVGGIQYDPAYGFPRFYWRTIVPHRPAGIVVESFAPAP